MRPLDFLGRIKVKLGIVIVLAVVTAFVVNEVGIDYGLSRDVRIAIAVVLALIMVQLLARGMTRPLREMAAATQTIAKAGTACACRRRPGTRWGTGPRVQRDGRGPRRGRPAAA